MLDKQILAEIEILNNAGNPNYWDRKPISESTPKFTTLDRAFDWVERQLAKKDRIDSYRFAYLNDGDAVQCYEAVQAAGCCGFFDEKIICRGREAVIGANFGH